MIKSYFFKKFYKPEFKSISGKNNLNLVLLMIIILVSLLTIGFGEGAKSYLGQKMDSPFVSFVNVTIPPSLIADVTVNDTTDKFVDQFNRNRDPEDTISFYDYFGVEKAYFVYHEIRNFTNPFNNNKVNAKIVMGKVNDPILDYIIDNDIKDKSPEFQKSTVNFDPSGWGCVVTEDFLLSENKMGLKDTDLSYLFYHREIDEIYEKIAIPIQGIVSSLPDNRDMIVGEKLYKSFDSQDFYIELLNSSYYLQYFTDDQDVKDYLENYNNDDIFFTNKSNERQVNLYDNSSVFYTDVSSIEDRRRIKNSFPNDNYIQTYIFDRSTYKEMRLDQVRERIVFEFVDKKKLGKIEEFNNFLKKNFTKDGQELKLDMSIVENKKNFDLFNKLAELLSSALIIFCIFTIIIYITNLIFSHISNNKKNLGTLKAFGLSNKHIITIYFTISIILIIIAFVLSYLVSIIVGNLIVVYMANFMGITDVTEFKYISLPIYSLVIYFIILPSAAIFIKLKYSLHSRTPGDLIYGRE